MSELSVEQRLENLEQGYKDVAYEYLDGLVKRIENIRTEVMNALDAAKAESRAADAKIVNAIDGGIKTLEEARDRVHGEVLNNVAEEVLATFSSGSHGMVRVPGQPHPVLARIK